MKSKFDKAKFLEEREKVYKSIDSELSPTKDELDRFDRVKFNFSQIQQLIKNADIRTNNRR